MWTELEGLEPAVLFFTNLPTPLARPYNAKLGMEDQNMGIRKWWCPSKKVLGPRDQGLHSALCEGPPPRFVALLAA